MAGRGIKWEKVCNNSRDRLRQDGELTWCRMHPPTLKVGAGLRSKRGSFLAIRTGKGPPDWVAMVNGISILGDDKDCKADSWYTQNIKKHQAKHFDEWEAQGGLSCILLRMGDKSRWVIPWSSLRDYYGDSKYIKMEVLKEIGFLWVHKCDGEPNYDWLTPLLEWHNERTIVP